MQRRIALGVVALAFVLDVLDSTIVNLAIPSIRAGLGVSDATVQWMVAGYALSFSMLLIIGGRLGDTIGYRTLFLGGVAAFAVTSLFCGLAQTGNQLAAARVLQGAAAAMMAPQVMSLVQLMYAPAERGSVMGLFGTLGGMSAALGPILGGLLIKADLFGLTWRPIFLVNLPIAALALIAGALLLPKGRSPHPLKTDLLGAGIIMTALFMLVFPLIEGRERGWPLWAFAMMAASAPVFGLFGLHITRKDRRDGSALAPPALFRDPVFRVGLLVTLFLQLALGGYFLTFSMTLQLGLRLDVLAASLATVPFAVGVGLGVGLVSRRLATRLGRQLVTLGMGVLVFGWLLLALALHLAHGAEPPRLLLAPVLLLAGAGMGMAIGPLSSLVLSGVDVSHAGAASGVLNAVQQLGGALGVAALGALYFAVQAAHVGAAGFTAAFPYSLVGSAALVAVAAILTQALPSTIASRAVAAH
jgi:EmrB/QacA subfamily drug resistance transporter